jgi:hypothetical protein
MAGLQTLCPKLEDGMVDWWTVLRKELAKRRRRGFDSLVVLVWWFSLEGEK